MTLPPPVPLSDWADSPAEDGRLYLHASAVALDGQAVLIVGASGSGKSQLALSLMVHGAQLVADDGIWIDPGLQQGNAPFVERPATATDLIESRGIGLLRAGSICGRAPLELVVDLDRPEPERLPPMRTVSVAASVRPLILGANHPSLATSVVWFVRHGRAAPTDPSLG